MNKRTITIDQLIREEHLKLQKENYIKNLISKIIVEQKTNFKLIPIGGGTIKNALVPILKSAGFDVEYSGNIPFVPIQSTDPLSQTPIVKNKFKENYSGFHFKNINISGDILKNLMIGIPLVGQKASFNSNGDIMNINMRTKNVSFDITNLPKILNSLSGKEPPFSAEELRDQYILDPNGFDATIVIKYIKSAKTIPIDSPEYQQINLTQSSSPAVLNVNVKTIRKKSGVTGIAYFEGLLRTNNYDININITGQLIPIYSVDVNKSKSDSIIEKDLPDLDSIKDNKFVPMTNSGETTTPDAFLDQLTASELEELFQLKNELENGDPLYREIIGEWIASKFEWLSDSVPKWLLSSAQFIAWFFKWIAFNNPVSQLIMNPSLDNLQSLLNWLGFIDIYFIGTAVDLINASISLTRYSNTGNDRFLVDAAISAFAAIPFYGLAGNFSNIFKTAKTSKIVRKTIKRSADIATVLSKISKSKLWKSYLTALRKKDVNGMVAVLAKMEKKGLLTREQLAYMAGSDGAKVMVLFLNSGKKNLSQFQKYLTKLNKKLPPKSRIDIEWAIENMDDAAKWADSIDKSFQLAYNAALRPNIIQKVTGVTIRTVIKSGKKVTSVTYGAVKSIARFTGIWALMGSMKFAFATTALRIIIKNNKFLQKLFGRRKLVDMGEDAGAFLRKMWYQDLWGNTGKLSLVLNKSFSVSIQNLNKSSKQIFAQVTGNTSATFIDVFNTITGKSFKQVTKISKNELDAFLSTLKNGAFKVKGVNKQSQKALYKEIARVVSASSAEKTSRLWVNFQADGLKNILNGKLSKYWTREAVQQQGFTALFNGISSIKFADIAFDEVNALFDKEGIGWGQDPVEADKEKATDTMKGVFLKFIYDSCIDYDVPYEQNIRATKDWIVDKAAPYWKTLSINKEAAIDLIKNNFENITEEQANKLKYRLEAVPGLVGDINTTTGRLIAPKYIMVGNSAITNPWSQPAYTGPQFLNQELYATTGTRKRIGNDWHTGDGKTGRKLKYWKAGPIGIPKEIILEILKYDINTSPEEINIPLTINQKTSLSGQLDILKSFKAAAKKIAGITTTNGPEEYIWMPGPPSAKQITAFIEQETPESSDPGLLKTLYRHYFKEFKNIIDKPAESKDEIDEQWFKGPYGKEHDYSDYGGPWGEPGHKTDFKKGPGKTPTKSIGYGRGQEEKEDDRITGYKPIN